MNRDSSRSSGPLKWLLIGAPLVAIGIGYWALQDPSDSGSEAVAVEPELDEAAVDSGAPAAAALEQDSVAAAPRSELPAPTESEEDAVEPPDELLLAQAGDADLVWIAGSWKTASSATPAPPDPNVRIVAVREALSRRKVFGKHGVLERFDRYRAANAGIEWASVATPAADGTFRIALPKGQEEAFLVLQGDFLYSSEPAAVRAGESAVLEVEVGALVEGTLRLPSGLPAGSLPDTIQLEPDGMSMTFGGGVNVFDLGLIDTFELRGEVDGDGHFRIPAVAPGVEMQLIVKTDEIALSRVEISDLLAGERRVVDIELSPGGRISGFVVDETGEPVAGAEVKAMRVRSVMGNRVPVAELRKTESDADGSFVLAAVASGAVSVQSHKAGFLDSRSVQTTLADHQEEDGIELTLESGGAIRGTVRFPEGGPAAGVQVQAEIDPAAMMTGVGMNFSMRGRKAKAKSDSEGKFALVGLGKGPFNIAVDHKDDSKQLWIARAKGAKPGEELTMVLEHPGVLSGTALTQAGEPIVKFHVVGQMQSSSPFLPSTERVSGDFESEDGTFELSGFLPGKYDIEATSEGYSASETMTVEFPRESEEAIELVMPRAARATGRVLAPDGSPVAHARIGLEEDPLTRASRMGTPQAETTSDENGDFVLEGLSPGVSSLVAHSDGYADSVPTAVEAESGASVDGVELRLRRGGTITGEVFDADGELAGGVQVVLQITGTVNIRMTETDADGHFREENLVPGTWQTIAMLTKQDDVVEDSDDEGPDIGELMGNLRMDVVELADEEEKHVVLGRPPADPVIVEGTILGAEGDGQFIVSFLPLDGEDSSIGGLKIQEVDENGEFELQLDRPGEYLMTTQALRTMNGQQQQVEFRQTIPKVERHRLEVQLPLGVITGRIVGPKGDPAASVRVSLTTDRHEVGTLMGGQYAEIQTDDNGAYELRFLRPGTYNVAAGGSLFGGAFGGAAAFGREVASGVKIEEGQTVKLDFRLPAPVTISGTVQDALGSPVSGVNLFVRNESGNLVEPFSMVKSDGAGRFTYEGLSPGEYWVSGRSGDLASSSEVRVKVDANGANEPILRMESGGHALVVLVDKSGEAVRASIRVTDDDGREVTGMIGLEELMQSFGKFGSMEQQVGPLPPGRYLFAATTSDGRTARKRISINAGDKERKVRLRLRE